jgi:copper chaperone NosL
MTVLNRVLGPRVTKEEMGEHVSLYRRPGRLLVVAAILLLVSLLLPYWVLQLSAPQFPEGLTVTAYVNRLEGDVGELEGLNHYVGLGSFEDSAVFERSVAVVAILGLVTLLLAGLFIHSRWVLLLTLPALLFPFIFLADLQFWLYDFGHNLDPLAPLAAAVGEFTPPIFGPAEIAQFETLALPGAGLLLAFAASFVIAYALVVHRRVYKPLIEAIEASE